MECEKHCEIAVGLQEIDSRSKSNVKRLDKLEDRVDNVEVLASSMKAMAQKQEYMDSDIKEIKADVKTLAEKPGKRWDGLIEKIIAALVGGVIAFLLARAGIG